MEPASGDRAIQSVSTDSEIIARSFAEPVAFGELFDRHAPALHRYLTRRSDPTTADDLVAQTFLTAFERRTGYRADTDESLPWLFGIATNLLRRHFRAESRALRAHGRMVDVQASDPTDAVAQRIDDARAVSQVLANLARLSRPLRETLLLYAWAELSYDEVAAAMDVPVGTVRSRINRARTALRGGLHTTVTSRGEFYGRDDASSQRA